jgi:N-acetylated-alpha-linked acidic dipeptidase
MKKVFFIAVILFCSTVNAQTKTITGFTTQSAAQQYTVEQNFDKNLSSTNIGNTIKELSSRPHNLGSAGSKVGCRKYLQPF